MSPQTKRLTVYTFDELEESAKERARDQYREHALDYDWWEYTVEDAKRIGALMGIQADHVYFSGFSSQGDGACLVGSYSYQSGGALAVTKECPPSWTDAEGHEHENKSNREVVRIARELQELQRRHFYRLSAVVRHTGHYNHENSVTIDVYSESYGATATAEEELSELLRDFMRWIYRGLEAEYDYRMSDEAVDEDIRANEHTFDASGRYA